MDTDEYMDKINVMLSDLRIYKKLRRDPTCGYKEKLMALLTGLKDQNKISQHQYRDLCPISDLVPQLYGSPKIHKPGNPLSPITNYTRLLAYVMLKALADLFKPLVGKTSYHVKNMATFSKELKDLHVEDDEIINSHDMMSLFTNVPIKKVLEVIRKHPFSGRSHLRRKTVG